MSGEVNKEAPPPGYLGHLGPTVCVECGVKRPPKEEVEYWGYACSRCTKILCEDCGKKDGMVLPSGGFHGSMSCAECLAKLKVAR